MRSDNVTKGAERAPNRSLFYALGYTPEDLEKPLIAVVSAHSDIVPGHMNLDKIAEAVKAGIRAAGGTPVMFPAIAVHRLRLSPEAKMNRWTTEDILKQILERVEAPLPERMKFRG